MLGLPQGWLLGLTLIITLSQAALGYNVGLVTSQLQPVPSHLGSNDILPVVVPEGSDPLYVRQAVCKALDQGVIGLVDTTTGSPLVRQALQQLVLSHHVPLVSVRTTSGSTSRFGISLAPSELDFEKAVKDVIHSLDWASFSVIYDSLERITSLEGFINDPNVDVNVFRIHNQSQISGVLDAITQIGDHRIVLALDASNVGGVLQEAAVKGLNTSWERFFVANLDSSIDSVTQYLHDSDSRVALMQMDLKDSRESLLDALFSDAVSLLSVAASNLQLPSSGGQDLCATDGAGAVWRDGDRVLDALKKTEFGGRSGLISFGEDGRRVGYNISVVQLSRDEPRTLMQWGPSSGVTIAEWALRNSTKSRSKRQLPTLRVSGKFITPYIKLKEGSEGDAPFLGNDRYEGLCVDILDLISAYAGFNYVLTIRNAPNGAFDPNSGRWTGLVGDLVRRTTDVIIGDITVTRQRESVIDFTKPWHTLGVGILGLKPKTQETDLFAFLAPFSLDVWIYLLVTFIVFTFLFFLIARLTPFERNPPGVGETLTWSPYTLLNSGWFTVSALLRQTPQQQPRALSTRFLGGIWWAFTLIIVALYIVNLVMMYQVSSSEVPIESVYDLANQNKIKYGAHHEGSTWRQFKTSQLPVYQKIYAGLQAGRTHYRPSTNNEAIDLIRESGGNYVYFMEEPTLEFITERNCDLTRIGGQITPLRAYAFGLQKGSQYLSAFNDALLRMMESGELHMIYRKWMIQKGGGQCVTEENYDNDELMARELSMNDVGGIFIILVIGVVVALIIAIVECCCYAGSMAKQRGEPFGSEISNQFKLAVKGPPSSNPNIVVRGTQ